MGCVNNNALINSMICLILMFCCSLIQPVGAIGSVESSGNTSVEEHLLREASDARRIIKIAYFVDRVPIGETTTPLSPLSNQVSVHVGARLSEHAIQQSIKVLYATQQYSQIQVYAQETPDGIVLTYQMTSFERIKAIEFIGIPANQFRQAIEVAMKSKVSGKYVPAIVKADVSRIKQVCEAHGHFDAQVTTHNTLTEDGTLTYQINVGTPSVIKKLQIRGNRAISTNRLKAACDFSRLSPIYNRSRVDTDKASMLALYRKSNYLTTTIVAEFIHKSGLLQFQINEGKHVALNFVLNVGELSSSQEETFKKEIAMLLKTAATTMWEQKIKTYFKDQGYHDTAVREEVPNESSIRLTINPGTRYRVAGVTFSGNQAFSDAELRREMTTGPVGGFWQHLQARTLGLLFGVKRRHFFYQKDLDTDLRQLRILYQQAGYPKVVIEEKSEKKNANRQNIGEVAIDISIVENRKEVIHRCAISGNRAIDTPTLLERLQSELQLPQPNASLERTTYQNAVEKAYKQLGYIDARVNDTYISETETPVLKVKGNFSAALADGKLALEIQDEFKKHNLSLVGFYIATNVDNRWSIQDIDGNPRYTLKQETTELQVFEHGILHLTVVNEGERLAFGKFYFQGDTEIVKQNVLDREVASLEGNLWKSERLSLALQNLYSLGIFGSVQYKRLQTQQAGNSDAAKDEATDKPHSTLKTTDVLITVEQQKPRTYRYGGGYSFAEGWRGSVELTDSNFLFKRNIRGRLLGRLGWRDELGYLFDARFTEPWLIWRIQGSLQGTAKKLEIDDNVQALEGSFILNREFGQSHYLDLRYSYRDLNQPVSSVMEDTPLEIGLSEELRPFSTTVSSLRFSWTYDSLVQSLNPIGGILNEITLEYAGGILRGETSFIKTTTETQYYHKLIGDLILATAVRFGVTNGLRSNRRAELISFERFWAGGSTTVRGYAERSLGPEDSTGIHRGDVQFIFKTELRFPIYRLVRGALFFDAGNVWDSLDDLGTITQLPSAVGTGLYLDFGALTFGVDYAIPLVHVPSSPDTRLAHIRLGSTF